MKVCLIIHSLGIGGMERVMALLCKNFFLQKKAEVHLILIGRKRNIEYPIPDGIIIHKPSFTFDNAKRVYHTVRTLVFVRKTVKSISPNTVLSFGEMWNSLVLLSLLGTRFPVFVSDRCNPAKKLNSGQEVLRKVLYKQATGIIAQTKHSKDLIKKNMSHQNISIIGNPIRFIPSKNKDRTENKVVLSVGRLIETKNHDRLIDIFLNSREEGWKLIIVGGDAQKQQNMVKLQKLIKDRGAEDYIQLAGERKDVERFYQMADIFAFTSSSEGFPNVIGEALSAGLPVISYDCVTGPSDMINHGKNGYLVNLFDDQLFEDYLNVLMNDQTHRNKLGENAKASIQDNSIDKISDKFYEFITST